MKQELTQYEYSDAAIPLKFTICGLVLRDFCLGHLILLRSINSPMLQPEPVMVQQDIGLLYFYLSLLVCAMTYEEGVKVLDDPKQLEELSAKFIANLAENMKLNPQWNYFTEINQFHAYMRYFLDMPLYTEETKDNDRPPSGTDWKTNIKIIFNKLGYKETEILNMSIKKLFYEWSAYGESEGSIRVFNKFEYEQVVGQKNGKPLTTVTITENKKD